MSRCEWPRSTPLMLAYHDTEWGVPLRDDGKLFEFLVLEGMQAGLSWSTILNKRENFRRAFDRFQADVVAAYGAADVRRLLADPGIIRNRLKIQAAITNAQAFLRVREAEGGFSAFMWDIVGGRPIRNRWRTLKELPCRTPESDRLSRELTQRGFTFVGSTICYAHMQATGMVNDHIVSCFRHAAIRRLDTQKRPPITREPSGRSKGSARYDE